MNITVSKSEARLALTKIISFVIAMVVLGLLKYLSDLIPGVATTRIGNAYVRDWIEVAAVVTMAVMALQLTKPIRTLVYFYALIPLTGKPGFERVRKESVNSVNALIFLVVVSLVFGFLSSGPAVGNITGFYTANKIVGFVGVICGLGGLVVLGKNLIPLCGTLSNELARTLMPVKPTVCSACGLTIDSESAFCTKCGAKQ